LVGRAAAEAAFKVALPGDLVRAQGVCLVMLTKEAQPRLEARSEFCRSDAI
jgi:hypothetical protein